MARKPACQISAGLSTAFRPLRPSHADNRICVCGERQSHTGPGRAFRPNSAGSRHDHNRPSLAPSMPRARRDRDRVQRFVRVSLARQRLNLRQRRVGPDAERRMRSGQTNVGEDRTEPLVGFDDPFVCDITARIAKDWPSAVRAGSSPAQSAQTGRSKPGPRPVPAR